MQVKANNVIKNTSVPAKENMKDSDFETEQINLLLKEAKEIAVVPSKTAGADSFCAAIGLFLMLKQRYEQDDKKKFKFLYTGNIPNEGQGLIGDEDITSSMEERELMLAIDYSGTNATKIQYDNDKENETFYFKLGPVSKNFDTNRIKARITGFDFDLIFVVGAQELADLGPIYNNLRGEINRAKKIVLDNTNKNSRFGVVNLIDATADSQSAVVFKNAAKWGLVPTDKAAKALLKGMTYREAKHN